MAKELKGVCTIMTPSMPCTADGDLDEESLRKLVSWLIRKGADTVGTDGAQNYEDSDAFRKSVCKIMVDEANGKIPVTMGTGSYDLATAVKRAKEAEDIGVDAIYMDGPPMSVPLGPNPRVDIVDYLAKITNSVNVPTVVHNTGGYWPGWLTPQDLIKLNEKAPGFQYVKEVSPAWEDTIAMTDGLKGSKVKIIMALTNSVFHRIAIVNDRPNKPVGITGWMPTWLPVENKQMMKAFDKHDIKTAYTIWNTKILPLADIIMGRLEEQWSRFGYKANFGSTPAQNELMYQWGIYKTARVPWTAQGVPEYLKKMIKLYKETVQPDID